MKVLHIIPTLGSGGAEKMLVDLVEELHTKNVVCEVAVLTKTNDFFGSKLQHLCVEIYYSSSSKIYSLKNISFLRTVIQYGNYDYIHTHLFAPQLFTPIALKLARKSSTPLITTEHSTSNRRRNSKKFYAIDYWMYQQYAKVIAITNETKYYLNAYLPNTKQKTVVVENGIQISQYANATTIQKSAIDSTISDHERIVVMVAAMREQKDHETLIRASHLLPENYRVVFVGDGERMAEVKQYAEDYGRKSILFLGSRADVPNILKASDVFVLSSKWEGFGLVAVEAAAAGLPVVASDVAGLSGVVQQIGGQVFEPFNEEDLASKIVEALQHKRECYDVSAYAIEQTAQKYLEIYQDLLKD